MARTRRVYRTPWDAAARFVTEEALVTLAAADSTRSDWRTKGVPADVFLPLLLDRLAAPRPVPGPPPVSPKERKVGTELAWRVILLARDHPEQARGLVALLRALRPLTPAEADVLHHLDFQVVVQGGAQ